MWIPRLDLPVPLAIAKKPSSGETTTEWQLCVVRIQPVPAKPESGWWPEWFATSEPKLLEMTHNDTSAPNGGAIGVFVDTVDDSGNEGKQLIAVSTAILRERKEIRIESVFVPSNLRGTGLVRYLFWGWTQAGFENSVPVRIRFEKPIPTLKEAAELTLMTTTDQLEFTWSPEGLDTPPRDPLLFKIASDAFPVAVALPSAPQSSWQFAKGKTVYVQHQGAQALTPFQYAAFKKALNPKMTRKEAKAILGAGNSPVVEKNKHPHSAYSGFLGLGKDSVNQPGRILLFNDMQPTRIVARFKTSSTITDRENEIDVWSKLEPVGTLEWAAKAGNVPANIPLLSKIVNEKKNVIPLETKLSGPEAAFVGILDDSRHIEPSTLVLANFKTGATLLTFEEIQNSQTMPNPSTSFDADDPDEVFFRDELLSGAEWWMFDTQAAQSMHMKNPDTVAFKRPSARVDGWDCLVPEVGGLIHTGVPASKKKIAENLAIERGDTAPLEKEKWLTDKKSVRFYTSDLEHVIDFAVGFDGKVYRAAYLHCLPGIDMTYRVKAEIPLLDISSTHNLQKLQSLILDGKTKFSQLNPLQKKTLEAFRTAFVVGVRGDEARGTDPIADGSETYRRSFYEEDEIAMKFLWKTLPRTIKGFVYLANGSQWESGDGKHEVFAFHHNELVVNPLVDLAEFTEANFNVKRQLQFEATRRKELGAIEYHDNAFERARTNAVMWAEGKYAAGVIEDKKDGDFWDKVTRIYSLATVGKSATLTQA